MIKVIRAGSCQVRGSFHYYPGLREPDRRYKRAQHADPECRLVVDECERVIEQQDSAERPDRPPCVLAPPQHHEPVPGRKLLQPGHKHARAGRCQDVAAPEPARLHAAAQPRVGCDPLQHRIARCQRGVEELLAAGQLSRAAAVAEQSEVADALEAVGYDVQQEAPDELVRVEGHNLMAVVVAVVFPAKGDGAVSDLGQAGVGDNDMVDVVAEIVEHLLRPAKRSTFTPRLLNHPHQCRTASHVTPNA